jgi:hypothetical protein
MTEILEVAELSQHHRVPQMKIGGGRVESELDPKRGTRAAGALELLDELGLHDDVGGPSADDLKLLVDGAELHDAQSIGVVSHRF